jgi:toxin ParE1/3/4
MRVIYSAAAQEDLVEIGGYIALDSERQAESFVASLQTKASQIAKAPRIYRARDDLSPGLRSAAFGSYLLLFREVSAGIEILHIVHGARDLKRLFEE